jgi:hypothetical protein
MLWKVKGKPKLVRVEKKEVSFLLLMLKGVRPWWVSTYPYPHL